MWCMFVISHDFWCMHCMDSVCVWVEDMLEVIEVVDVMIARDEVCVAVVDVGVAVRCAWVV